MNNMNKKSLPMISVGLIFLFLVGCNASTPTPTPGIGVNVRGGGWEVKIAEAHQETELKVGSGFNEKSWTAKEGYAFLVVDVTFRQLDSSSTTPAPVSDNPSETPTSSLFDTNSISTNQVALLDQEGTIVTSAGAIFANGQMGDVCGDCSVTLFTGEGDLEVSLVFILKKDSISGKVFKFQFREVPLIPFTVE